MIINFPDEAWFACPFNSKHTITWRNMKLIYGAMIVKKIIHRAFAKIVLKKA